MAEKHIDSKIPKNQILWETLTSSDGTTKQIVTSDAMRNKWFLYEVANDGSLTKIETGSSPKFKKKLF